ncbi:hypothetical protein [uncultured Methanobrevibacter sp.]|uniref:hypothetical protein n=1 Tax=uncultured Methanobrevibacter sp. TaxID=253161 RepID=UPI002622757C|nr:hypothetical protein [uncultured Methanobrevibacter sp.]
MKIAKKLLLELALHRYDEEVQRNELIDSKNKSIVAFLGVMLTIQCTILPRLIEFKEILSNVEMFILVIIFLISLIFYVSSLLVFMSTLNNIDQIGTAPRIDWLIIFWKNNSSFSKIVQNTIISLNEIVEKNDDILEEKNSRGNLGLKLIKGGVIFTAIFIIYMIIIFY